VANAVNTTEDSPKGDLTAWEARTVSITLFAARVTEDRPGDPTARAFNFPAMETDKDPVPSDRIGRGAMSGPFPSAQADPANQ